MAWEIDSTDQLGTTGFAHKEFLLRVKALAEANGWVTMRYATGVAPTVGTGLQDELILKGEGLSGTEEIFVGIRTYESSTADYYNLAVAGFTGYVPANVWAAQPGFRESGVPAHNQAINYWLIINAQRIAFTLKVGTPVYESAYVGKCLPYATPSQYPYPMVVAGMLSGAAATRYSDTAHTMAFKGNRVNCGLRWLDGTYKTPETYPWNNGDLASTGAGRQLRDTGGSYPILPVILNDSSPNLYGELDGIFYVSNFNNTVESMIQIGGTPVVDNPAWTSQQRATEIITAGGTPYVCMQDVARTSFVDYFAMRLD